MTEDIINTILHKLFEQKERVMVQVKLERAKQELATFEQFIQDAKKIAIHQLGEEAFTKMESHPISEIKGPFPKDGSLFIDDRKYVLFIPYGKTDGLKVRFEAVMANRLDRLTPDTLTGVSSEIAIVNEESTLVTLAIDYTNGNRWQYWGSPSRIINDFVLDDKSMKLLDFIGHHMQPHIVEKQEPDGPLHPLSVGANILREDWTMEDLVSILNILANFMREME